MLYVTMTDKFMSGWGLAKDKINKLIFECETYNEAKIVADNAERSSEMKHISIRSTKPYYSSKRYYLQIKTRKEYPTWYEKD